MRAACFSLIVALLAACSSVPESDRPSPLPANTKEVAIRAAWSHQLGAWQDAPEGRLQPAMADGMVVFADGSNWLRAFDARSGKYRWELRTGIDISGGIAVAGDKLLLGTRYGEVIAYALKDGAVLWRSTLSSEVLTPPAVSGNVAVIRSGDGKLSALTLSDGKPLWSFERSVPTLSLRGTGSAVIAGDQVFAGFASGKLVALSLNDGNLLWEATVATPQGRSELERMVDVDADPLVIGDTVYAVAYQGRLVALSRDSGRVLWARDMSVYNNMTADDHALYLSDDKGAVWAIDRSSGAALWKQEKLHNRKVSAPVLFGDYVVVADYEGYLHWLSRDDGHLAGRYYVDDAGVVSAPFPVKNLLYVEGLGGGVEALRAQKSADSE
jgi:outer membrane protein assembly factor BamB